MIAIATTALRRYLRDRSNLFFVFVLPFLIIFLVGYSADSQANSPTAVVRSDLRLATGIVASYPDEHIQWHDTETSGRSAVEDNSASALLVFIDEETARFETKPGKGLDARAELDSAIAALTRQRQIDAAADLPGVSEVAVEQAREIEALPVVVDTIGVDVWGGLDNLAASSLTQVVLFMFLAALTAASFLVEDRELGMATRKATAPMTAPAIIVGEALGRILIILFQAALIMGVTWLFFDVGWGDPLATSATVILFALAATGAGILLGTIVDRVDAANAVGITAALVLAALGGAMAPVEVFPEAMQTVARATPHFWAIDGLQTSLTGGGIADIARSLVVLAVFSAVLLIAAVVMFRRKVFHR